ncbi:MAG: type II toxin-antitoxin system RelE/ParE family toxin [Selenomonadaceae bacterium]|nr:type II toxin-antitoxin system RelE/ParE family toxin [Selenomonadaceae bacterium]
MTREFIHGKKFDEQWKALGLNDDALKDLQKILLNNPKIGAVIQGTGRLRKMRFGIENRGKSHSVRVCYVDFEINEKIFLIMVFAKNEMDNLSQSEKNSIKNLIERIEKYLEGNEKK